MTQSKENHHQLSSNDLSSGGQFFRAFSEDSGCLYVFSHMPQVSAYEFRYILKCYIMHHYQKTPDHPLFCSPQSLSRACLNTTGEYYKWKVSGPKILSLAYLCWFIFYRDFTALRFSIYLVNILFWSKKRIRSVSLFLYIYVTIQQ